MNGAWLILALWVSYSQAYNLPAEPVIFATAPADSGLALEPSNPRPIVGIFLISCHNGAFRCSDNGGEFHICARWELAEVGLVNPRFAGGKCIANRQ